VNFRDRTLEELADMICGNDAMRRHLVYRSSSQLTGFFKDCETLHVHDGSTRKWWVKDTLETIMKEPTVGPDSPPDTFQRVIRILMDQADAVDEGPKRAGARSPRSSASPPFSHTPVL
jgi:hypothetical protein